jgi:tetratricopeptide (TPR) repeat protein
VEFPTVETIQLNSAQNRITAASALLERFVGDRNSLHAPAHLLRGVIKMKQGDPESAFVYFDQAASYFPQHTAELNDKLNLYKKREYLRDSREGNRLLSLYKGLMSGSGYFSPEFQKARILLEQGRDSQARDMVFDHFQRRKNQGEWDKVLDDFRFSNLFLGTSLTKIQGAESDDFTVLLKDSSKWTNLYADRLEINLQNKSDIDLHNVSMLLCVRFTDMFKNDYIAFPVERTVARLKSGDILTIEINDIKKITSSELGKERQFSDIINYGAVLISDELIMWAGQQAEPASENQSVEGT